MHACRPRWLWQPTHRTHLQARVHLHEVKVLRRAVSVHDELHGASVEVAHGAGGTDGGLANVPCECMGTRGWQTAEVRTTSRARQFHARLPRDWRTRNTDTAVMVPLSALILNPAPVKLILQPRGGRFLNDLLVAALHRAVAVK